MCIRDRYMGTQSIEEVYKVDYEYVKGLPEKKSQKIILDLLPQTLDPSWHSTNMDEKHWMNILRFLFSISARDCSILITFIELSSPVPTTLGHNEFLIPYGRHHILQKSESSTLI
eukprot:TRINITY_DN3680_c0_g2_i1.p1 TRINITY_DN3680_c0_g2~~TRINITY_DN3680_c0_g2_i1.p1  ORF type:complete len:115 (-),score=13.01 TRINITY_DN3680_c0_g2_i1:237-581(-)